MHGRAVIGCCSSSTAIYWLNQLEILFVDLKVWRVNLETLKGKSGEILEMLKGTSLGICCVKES